MAENIPDNSAPTQQAEPFDPDAVISYLGRLGCEVSSRGFHGANGKGMRGEVLDVINGLGSSERVEAVLEAARHREAVAASFDPAAFVAEFEALGGALRLFPQPGGGEPMLGVIRPLTPCPRANEMQTQLIAEEVEARVWGFLSGSRHRELTGARPPAFGRERGRPAEPGGL